MSRKLILLLGIVALVLVQSAVAQNMTNIPEDVLKVCGEFEISQEKDKCSAPDAYPVCTRCKKCKGGRISKGWMNLEKVAKEAENKSYGCHSIIVWLLPVIAGIIVIAAIIAFICWRRKKHQQHSYPVANPPPPGQR